MKLWYQQRARQWDEALPIGNGRLGGMVFGGVQREVLELNEDSIWNGKHLDRINPDAYKNLPKIRELLRAGRIPEAEQLTMYAFSGVPNSQRAYQPAGQCELFMNHSEEVTDYHRELDLDTGMVKVEYRADSTVYTRELFASFPDGVLVARFRAAGEKTLSFSARIGRKANWNDEVSHNGKDEVHFTVEAAPGGISFCVGMQVCAVGGTVQLIGEHLLVDGADEVTLCIGAETSFRHADYTAVCQNKLQNALTQGYESLKERHLADYQALFSRVALSFDCGGEAEPLPTDERLQRMKNGGEDPNLMALYLQYGRYLLIASSREGSLPATLQGIWNDRLTPPWDSKFTININTEMNYWMAETGNLPECHLPLFEHLERVKENGKETARRMYGCRGSVAHHNTDLYADTAPQDHYIPASYWVFGEAWLATHIWEHYSYTGDRAFLEQYFDILEQCVLFFYDFLIEGADGTLVTSPSVSPENTYIMQDGTTGCLCEGCTMDVEILTELFTHYRKACGVLGKEAEKAEKAAAVMARFPKFKIGKHGQLQEWMEDYDEAEPGHRHISHLYGVYPGTSLSQEDTPALMGAARATLERRLAHGGGHTGWSRAWIIGLWAKFGEGERAYEDFGKLLTQGTFQNLMDNHPMGDGFVFQIDGNFGASAALIEMLVQSRENRIALLPALPRAMESGSVKGLCLRGGGTLSMQWKDGKVVKAVIQAAEERIVTIRVNQTEVTVPLKLGECWEYRG